MIPCASRALPPIPGTSFTTSSTSPNSTRRWKEAAAVGSEVVEGYLGETHQALDAIQFFKTRYPEHIMRSIRALTFRAEPDDRELSLLRAISLEIVRFLERTGRAMPERPE